MSSATNFPPTFIGRNPISKVEIWAYRPEEVEPAKKALAKAEEKWAERIGGGR